MAMPNVQENVFVTDDKGTTILIDARATVSLSGMPTITLWGGVKLPERELVPTAYYKLQGSPSLGDRAVYWRPYPEAGVTYHVFLVDNYG